jgi:hypothetical protein
MGTDIAYTGHDGTRSDIWVVDVRGGQLLVLLESTISGDVWALDATRGSF